MEPDITLPIDAVPTPPVLDGTPKKRNYLFWILGILALAVISVTSFLILTGKSKSTPSGSSIQPSVSPEQTTAIAVDMNMSSWKTYSNSILGIALQYPSNWALNMDDQNAILTIKADPIDRSPGIEISSLNRQNYISLDHWLAQKDKECEEGKRLAEKTGGDSDCVVYSRLGERKINQFASSKVLWSCCGSGPTIRYFIEGPDKIYLVDLFPDDWRNDKLNAVGDYDEGSSKLAKIYQQILSSFEVFTKSTMEPSILIPITCKDKFTPVITSLSSNSGSVGTKLEIKGCNFSDFEGNIEGWIKNSQGINGLLRGETGSTSNLIKVTLKFLLCRNDPQCETPLTLTPGTYKIYVMSSGYKSNEINFTIK